MKPVRELIPSTQQSLFCGEYEQSSFRFPWHYHPQWELTYIIEGAGIAYTGNSIRHFMAGELVLIAPNTPHCWKSNASDKGQVKSIFLQWDNDYLGQDWLSKPEFICINTLFEQCEAGIRFSLAEQSPIVSRLQQLPQLTPFKKLWGFTDLLYEISLLGREKIGDGGKLDTQLDKSGRVEPILNYVNQHYSQPISAENMAQVTNMTPVSFSKYFSKTFGKPFTRFLNEYRVSQACSLLITTNKTVDEIAYISGYQNMSFFHRQFKLITGKTPLLFKQTYLPE